jgi:hypothetical protein
MADPIVARLNGMRSAARWRVMWIHVAEALPLLLLLVVLNFKASTWFALGVLLVLIGFGARLIWTLRGYDSAWLIRRFNGLSPELDDSLDLLLQPGEQSNALQRLQQQRLRERLRERPLPDLRPPFVWRRIAAFWGISALGVALSIWQPWSRHDWSLSQLIQADQPDAPVAGQFSLRVHVAPPAYTRLRAFDQDTADIQAAEGSVVEWRFRFAQAPSSAQLRFHDGSVLALKRNGDEWVGSAAQTQSRLYRIDAPQSGIDEQALHRLDIAADRAPEITVRTPDKTLNVIDAEQAQWRLVFEARDDYGLGQAMLSISLAQGDGEQIAVSEQQHEIAGEGDARERRYSETLDLAALGFAQGDDLIVRLTVSDNREPEPNTARSASFILRWPAQLDEESEGMEGVVKKTMPAYFRSQRQIIIDTEALLAQKATLSEDEYSQRADAIGVDQKLLRLRYGQFLGEESESGLSHDHHDGAAEDDHAGGDDHDEHEPAPAASAAGADAGAIVAQFGHVHDIAEAATLLDDATKSLLRKALDAMWRAEEQLRTAQLSMALPPENEALEAIKQVQQASRIYLARVGLDLPPIDPERRLTGDRAGLEAPPERALSAATTSDAALLEAWQALDRGESPNWSAVQASLGAQSQSQSSLGLLHGMDELRRSPDCAPCRERVKAQLWSLLPAAPTALRPRAALTPEQETYRRALPGAVP